MSLWKQALLLIASSLLIEIVFTALLWHDLSLVSSFLKMRANDVGIRVAKERLRDMVNGFQTDFYEACMSRHALPPGHMMQEVLLEKLYKTGEESKVSRVLAVDAKEIDARLAETILLLAQINAPGLKFYLQKIKSFFNELEKIDHGKASVYVQNTRARFNYALWLLHAASSSQRRNNNTQALQLGRQGLILLKSVTRQISKDASVECDKQHEEANGAVGFNNKFIDTVSTRLNILLWVGAALSVSTAAVLILIFSKTSSTRLLRLVSNMNRLSSNQPLLPVMEGRDDFASIDRTLAQMAAVIGSARKKERAIIENSAEMICSIDESGKFVIATSASEKVIGFDEEELRAMQCADIITGAYKSHFEDYFRQAKGRQVLNRIDRIDPTDAVDLVNAVGPAESVEPLECWIQRKDGVLICAQWTLTWIEKEKTGVCVIRDITERKRLEKSKQEFVAMVSQDLREPIASMQEFLTSTCDDKFGALSEHGRNLALASKRNNDRLLLLIDDLLNIDKMSRGKMEMVIGECSSCQIIQQSFLAVSELASRSKVKLESVGDDVVFRADSNRLVQVLVNLIGNAVKFSPANSTIICSVFLQNEQIEFQVIDQGRGIPADLVDSVFIRFKQVTKSDASEKGGAGLGLAICKSIIESHSGQIGANSEEGKGSTFWFRIPK